MERKRKHLTCGGHGQLFLPETRGNKWSPRQAVRHTHESREQDPKAEHVPSRAGTAGIHSPGVGGWARSPAKPNSFGGYPPRRGRQALREPHDDDGPRDGVALGISSSRRRPLAVNARAGREVQQRGREEETVRPAFCLHTTGWVSVGGVGREWGHVPRTSETRR